MYGNKLTEKPNLASEILPPSIKNFKIRLTGFGRLEVSVQFNKSTKKIKTGFPLFKQKARTPSFKHFNKITKKRNPSFGWLTGF